MSNHPFTGPRIDRSVTIHCVGDWGQANFHRISSWLSQEFCDRAGPKSRTAIWSLRDGGLDSILQVYNGEADLGISTPTTLLKATVLPQRDRLMFAAASGLNISSFADIRDRKLPLRIAVSEDDGSNLIGYISARVLEAHRLDEETMHLWGGSWVKACRPEQVIDLFQTGQADAVIQEAIMTPWWRDLIENRALSPVEMDDAALDKLSGRDGFQRSSVKADFWSNLTHNIQCVDFSDFVVVVRDDMPHDIAHLLTWCLVETRHVLEAQ
ncbi:hypothetical protein N7509_000453 [Penicillium cosmopolitanum]|uniref:Uncharacterized protein n=1 Tax=Penicillium cosmopolitanum TaxID=1131564 RepID=A0A9W9WAC3_9EURO|nr:uncharacterized protein N7509_000453 [Penicillium cosmopolitanum]KAJ5413826.1 hypothetical protein N7509_000453 [Penicillium cosmopolitanum]